MNTKRDTMIATLYAQYRADEEAMRPNDDNGHVADTLPIVRELDVVEAGELLAASGDLRAFKALRVWLAARA
jgi:hypothetical protein